MSDIGSVALWSRELVKAHNALATEEQRYQAWLRAVTRNRDNHDPGDEDRR